MVKKQSFESMSVLLYLERRAISIDQTRIPWSVSTEQCQWSPLD